MHLKGRVTRQKREIFDLLVHSPSDCNGQGWGRRRQEPGVASRCPTWVQGPKYLSQLLLLFQGTVPQVKQQGLEPAP